MPCETPFLLSPAPFPVRCSGRRYSRGSNPRYETGLVFRHQCWESASLTCGTPGSQRSPSPTILPPEHRQQSRRQPRFAASRHTITPTPRRASPGIGTQTHRSSSPPHTRAPSQPAFHHHTDPLSAGKRFRIPTKQISSPRVQSKETGLGL